MRRHVLLASLALLLPPSLPAQAPRPVDVRDDAGFSFYERGPYRAGVPRPDSLIGHAIGDVQTTWAQQERALLAIAAAAPDRVHVEEIATTPEGRTMRLFVVTAPEHRRRLDAIRADLDRLADPRGASDAELAAVAARTPAVVMLSFSVHGNESRGFEAVMPVLYQLTASEEPATLEMLRRTVVVLNPSSNPDGHERFAVWYNSVLAGHPDPEALEHNEPWSVQGRFNHYRFDMNRDVFASTQHEVQGIVAAMLRWHPMVAVDLHGMTEQYFFPPAARPVNEHIGAASAKWLEVIGRGNAAAFDERGWLYYVRDVFDLFYPGYWDTWPSLTGATGMTYETDGGGWKGVLWRRDDGTLLSFRDGIAKHHVAALATIATVAARAEERVRDYVRFRQDAIAAGTTGAMRRVIFTPGTDPQRAAELALTLRRAGIEVRRTTAPYSARATAYADGRALGRRFEAGSYVVDLAQPQGRLARALLEPAPRLDTAFARAQLERFLRNQRRGQNGEREGYEFYDVTAWSLPVAFGVSAYYTDDLGTVEGELLPAPATGPVRGVPMLDTLLAWRERDVGVRGGVVGGRARSAYVFSPERSGAAPLAMDLLRAGVRVAVATQPLDAAGRQWPRGTWVVRVSRNDTTVHALVDALARRRGVEVTPVASAFADSGQYGVGSEMVTSLVRAPRIALVGDEGVDQTSFGALWWSLERRYGIPLMPVGLRFLAGGDLTKVDVIVLPDASPGALAARLGKDGADRLRAWVERGGTLVTMAGSTAWAAREDVDLTSARRVGANDSTAASTIAANGDGPAAADTLLAVTSPGAAPDAPEYVPGAHFDVVLDRTHWLTYGMPTARPTVLLSGDTFLTLSRAGTNVGVFPATGPLHRAGFVWPNTERLLRNTAFLVAERHGAGHVVLFANDPMFRGWWRALDHVVLNALLLGPTM